MLKDLYTDFLDLSPEEQVQFINHYRQERDEVLHKSPVKKTPAKRESLELTEEEQILLKLGLKKKDILALRLLEDVVEEELDTEEDEEEVEIED